jgi:hypothetical protein
MGRGRGRGHEFDKKNDKYIEQTRIREREQKATCDVYASEKEILIGTEKDK